MGVGVQQNSVLVKPHRSLEPHKEHTWDYESKSGGDGGEKNTTF